MRRVLFSAVISIALVGMGLAAPATQASPCGYYLSTYERLMAEAQLTNDIDLASRAQYWYQDYEACLEREANNSSSSPSGGSSNGSSGGSSSSPSQPTYVPPPRDPSCSSVQQPIPRGRQVGPNTVTFAWDPDPRVNDYQVNASKTVGGVLQDWSGFTSLGRASSYTVEVEQGGSVYFNVIAMCTGSSDGYIYPAGMAYVNESPVSYTHRTLSGGWACSGNQNTQAQTCTKTWTIGKKKSKNARKAINKVMNSAMTELSVQQAPPQESFSVDAMRVGKGKLRVTIRAKIAGDPQPYAEGSFVPRS